MIVTTLSGAKDGVNQTFTLAAAGNGLVLVMSAGRMLKQASATPGPFEFTLSGLTVVVGTPPLPGGMLFAYIENDTTQSLKEILVFGLQNGANLSFTQSEPVPLGSSLILFKNGSILEPVATLPNTVQYQPTSLTTVSLGLAPLPTDRLRAFIAQPGTSLMYLLVLLGNQDSANTRYSLTYTPVQGSEPTLFITFDGILQARTLIAPAANQYLLVDPRTFVLGFAPAATTALQALLIGTASIALNPHPFTQSRLARRVGIFVSRALDEAECEEAVSQAYTECLELHQWSFLSTHSAFTTEPLKTDGTVAVTTGSRIVVGTGTSFAPSDIGKRFRISSYDAGYEVTNVDVSLQRLEITPAYADVTTTGLGYELLKTAYSLGIDAEYIFSMTGRQEIRERPLSVIDRVDPSRFTTSDTPVYFAYRERNARGELEIELYPVPSSATVIRYTVIRRDVYTDGSPVLRAVENIVFNLAAAGACRIAATKGQGKPDVWLQLMASYEAKGMQHLERLNELDWTRSDIAKEQSTRADTYGGVDGTYMATHDVGEWEWDS